MSKRKAKIVSVSSIAADCAKVKLSLDEKEYKKNLNTALYQIHYEMSNKKLAKELVSFAKKNQDVNEAPFSILPDYMYSMVGKYCFVINKGGELDNDTYQKIVNIINDLAEKAIEKNKEKVDKTEETKKESGKVLTIQDRLRIRAEEVCSEFEEDVDHLISNPKKYDIKQFDSLRVLKASELKPGHLRYVIKFYEPEIKILNEYLENKKDTDLKEAYGYLGVSGVKKLIKLYQNIIDSANMIIKTTKSTRKTKKRKVVPASKVVEKLKYMKEYSDLKIASINPVDIIGASILWFYNTKTRKIGFYKAFDETGLSVKGTTITNVAEASKQKNLRKPKDQIKLFKGTKKSYEKQFDSINAVDIKPSPRVNENIILLKVFK